MNQMTKKVDTIEDISDWSGLAFNEADWLSTDIVCRTD